MIRLLTRVIPKSIINICAMNPKAFRDELDILSGVQYGFTKTKQTPPPQKPI
jgi:hypothetical protein